MNRLVSRRVVQQLKCSTLFIRPTISKSISNTSFKSQEIKKIETNPPPTPKTDPPEKPPSNWAVKHGWKILSVYAILIGYILIRDYGPPELDQEGNPIPDEFTGTQFEKLKRAKRRVEEYVDIVKEPMTEKLLPDPVLTVEKVEEGSKLKPRPKTKPYTVVIEMKHMLFTPEWTLKDGWRFKKRPGLDFFLEQLQASKFEVVLFTREPYHVAEPIAAELERDTKFDFKLYRESTKYINGEFIKDISYLNRNLEKVVTVDWSESASQLQPRNAIHRLKKWEGDESDKDLYYLAIFFKTMSDNGVEDVRDVLDFYNTKADPLGAFKDQVRVNQAPTEPAPK